MVRFKSDWVTSLLLSFGIASSTHAAVGFTPGSFNVSPSGAANYSIPIAIPPGTAGVQPQVSLNYNSQGGDGLAGHGWGLSGGSAITRCGQTLASNNKITGVNLDSGDRFCLDGQQLFVVNGKAYGSNNAQYRTEIESFQKIISTDSNGDKQPEHFKVWTKGGEIKEYGKSGSQQIVTRKTQGGTRVLAWHVSKISDRVNNYIQFVYTGNTTTGELYLGQIKYTGHTANPTIAPYSSVRFAYQARPDYRTHYIGDGSITNDQRLKTISVYEGSTRIRQYKLTYQSNSADNVSRLSKMQECDGGSDCLPATNIGWMTRSKGWATAYGNPPKPLKGPWETDGGTKFQYRQGQYIDVNGDGLSDFVQSYKTIYNTPHQGTWINTGSGWALDSTFKLPSDAFIFGRWRQQTNDGNTAHYQSQEGQFADVNSDGLPDFVVAFNERLDDAGNNLKSHRVTYLNMGSVQANGTVWKADNNYKSPVDLFGPYHKENGSFWEFHNGDLLDVNGDGRVDIVYAWSGRNGSITTPSNGRTYLNTGSGWDGTSAASTNYKLPIPLYGPWFRDDGRWYEYHQGQFADVNGDGLPDFVQAFKERSGTEHRNTYLNTGSSWQLSASHKPPALLTSWHANTKNGDRKWNESQRAQLTDINGDGIADFVQSFSPGLSTAFDNCECTTWLGTGKKFIVDNNYKVPAPMNGPWFQDTQGNGIQTHYQHTQSLLADVNMDGLQDFVRAVKISATIEKRQTWVNTGRGWRYESAYNLPVPIFGEWVLRNKSYYKYIQGQFADANGDGAADFIRAYQDINNNPALLKTYTNKRAFQPDIVVNITNGLGKKLLIGAQPLTNKSIYTKGPINETGVANSVAIQSPMYVVNSHRSSNGLGAGLAKVNYYYYNARADLKGRGLLGMGRQTIIDTTTGISTQTTNNQTFPYIGTARSVIVKRSNGTKLSTTVNQYKTITASCGVSASKARKSPYLSKSTKNTYELGNANPVSSVISETKSMSACGSVNETYSKNSNAKDGTGNHYFEKITKNTYFGDDIGGWVLSKLKDATVTHKVKLPAKALSQKVRKSAFTYLANGMLYTETIEPNFSKWLKTTHSYDAFGNNIKDKVQGGDIALRISKTGYDAKGRFATLSENAKNHKEFLTYDARFGLVKTLKGPNALTTTWTYDNFGRKKLEKRADNTQTAWTYASQVSGDYRYKITETSTGSPAVISFYDMLDRVRWTTTTALNGKTLVMKDIYDYRGNKTKTYKPYFSGETQYFTKTDFDELGRPFKVTQPDGGYIQTFYNGLTTTSKAYRKSFDGRGNKLLQSIQKVDPMGNVIEVTDHYGKKLTYEYDATGNLVRSKDAWGNQTVLTYDTRGEKKSMTDPDMGYWTYNYNALGELKSQKNANLQTTFYVYDVLGRKTSQNDGNQREINTWVYDGGNKGIGKLQYSIAKTTYGGTKQIRQDNTYDNLGRLKQVKDNIYGSIFTTKTAYNSTGRVATVEYPASQGVFRIRNVYNNNGYLTQIKDDISNKRYWKADAVDAAGNYTQVTLDNGIVQKTTFNAKSGFINTIKTGNNNTQNLQYIFDSLGNLERRNDNRQGNYEKFFYDDLNRMTKAQIVGNVSLTKTFQYDALGNIKYKSDVGNYTYGTGVAGPHAVTKAGNVTYTYDKNGNMLSGDNRTTSWLVSNKPRSITQSGSTVSFGYDASDTRAYKNGPNGTMYYADGLYEKHVKGGVQKHRYFIHADGKMVARIEKQKINSNWQAVKTQYMLHDHLGSVDTIVNPNGNITQRLSFDAFGERRLSNWRDGAVVSDFTQGYTGHEQDDEVSLVNMRGRLYDAKLGRFISADPHVQFASNMQSFNRYSYVLNNPLSFTDPSGYFLDELAENQYVQAVVTTAVSVACGGYAAVCAAATTTAFAKVNGATWQDSLKSGAISGVIVQFSIEIGADKWLQDGVKVPLPGRPVYVRAVIAHGVVGGTASVLQGGKFTTGFLTSGLTKSVSGAIHANTISVEGTIIAAIVGGTVSELSGGKFANGAQTAAFQYLYNELGLHDGYGADDAAVDAGSTAVLAVLPGGQPVALAKLGLWLKKMSALFKVGKGTSSNVKKVLDGIEQNGFKVKINPKNPATKQEVNATIDFGNKTKVNLRVESHPLKQGGPNVRHANVEVTRQVKNRNKVISNDHIVD